MPTYEYACKSCGSQIEVVQAFTDDALTTCETCGGDLRKVFGAIGISFKGSGFYKNDSRSSTSSSTPPAGESTSTEPKPSTETKSTDKKSEPAAAKSSESTATPKKSDSAKAS